MPGGGLGGKGFKEGAASEAGRTMIDPARQMISEPFNEALDRNDVDDARFEIGYPMTEVDPDKLKQSVYDSIIHGSASLNEGLSELGHDPVGDPNDPDNIANKHMIVAGAAIYVIEDMKTQGGLAIPTYTGKPPGSPGGPPAGPETAAEQDGAQHTPEDHNTLESIIGNLKSNGTMDGKFYSVPSGKVFKAPVLDKHCGVCEEDEAYYGAPIARDFALDLPTGASHVNTVEIVAMIPDGLPPKPALWKPQGGEDDRLVEQVGGALYTREAAAYLIDRSLNFWLVPLCYVADSDGEEGAVLWYSPGLLPGVTLDEYDPKWTVRAAVFDYVTSQQDRHAHNWNTLPDETDRPLLIDNGYSLPENEALYCNSAFCDLWVNKPLPDDVLQAMVVCRGDSSTWLDVQSLIGRAATQKALHCLDRLIAEKMITSEDS